MSTWNCGHKHQVSSFRASLAKPCVDPVVTAATWHGQPYLFLASSSVAATVTVFNLADGGGPVGSIQVHAFKAKRATVTSLHVHAQLGLLFAGNSEGALLLCFASA